MGTSNLGTRQKYRVGIDVGGTSVKLGLVDEQNNIIAKTSLPTECENGYEKIIDSIGNAILSLIDENELRLEQFIGAGAGIPGTIDSRNGVVVYSNNLVWENVPFVEQLQKILPLPLKIDNDANCAALGEVKAGAAKGYDYAVLFTLGTGVGSGIITNGRIFEGGTFGSGEIGHSVVVPGGVRCTCGQYGCLESYASATGLIREAKQAMLNDKTSVMWEMCQGSPENMNGVIPFEAEKKGDAAAGRVVDTYIKYLSIGIVNTVNALRPLIVLIGGGISNQGDNLLNLINQRINHQYFGGNRLKEPILKIAELKNSAGMIGAANLL